MKYSYTNANTFVLSSILNVPVPPFKPMQIPQIMDKSNPTDKRVIG